MKKQKLFERITIYGTFGMLFCMMAGLILAIFGLEKAFYILLICGLFSLLTGLTGLILAIGTL